MSEAQDAAVLGGLRDYLLERRPPAAGCNADCGGAGAATQARAIAAQLLASAPAGAAVSARTALPPDSPGSENEISVAASALRAAAEALQDEVHAAHAAASTGGGGSRLETAAQGVCEAAHALESSMHVSDSAAIRDAADAVLDVAGFARGPAAAAAAAALKETGWPLATSSSLPEAELAGGTACAALGLLRALEAMEGCASTAAASASALRGASAMNGGGAAGRAGGGSAALDGASGEPLEPAQEDGRVWARQAAAPVVEEAFLAMLGVGAGSWDDPSEAGATAGPQQEERRTDEPSRSVGASGPFQALAGASAAAREAGDRAAAVPAARVGWDAVDDVIDWEEDAEGPASPSSSEEERSSPRPDGHIPRLAEAGVRTEELADVADAEDVAGTAGVAEADATRAAREAGGADRGAESRGKAAPDAASAAQARAVLPGAAQALAQGEGLPPPPQSPGALLRPDRPDLLCRALRAVVVGCVRRASLCSRSSSAQRFVLSEAACRRAAESMLLTLLEWAGRVLADAAAASAGVGTLSAAVVAQAVSLACECELLLERELPPLLLEQCAHAEEASYEAREREREVAGGRAAGEGAAASADAAAGWQSGLARRRLAAPPCVRAVVTPLWSDMEARTAWLDAELQRASSAVRAARRAFQSLQPGAAKVLWEPAKPLWPACERQCAAAAGALSARRARQLALLLPGAAARSGVMREFAAAIADMLCADAARAVSAVQRAADSRSGAQPWVLDAGVFHRAGLALLDPFEDCRAVPSRPPHLRLPTAFVDGVCIAGACRAAAAELRGPVLGADPAATAPACRRLVSSADAVERAVGEAAGTAAASLARLTVSEAAAARLRLRPQRPKPAASAPSAGAGSGGDAAAVADPRGDPPAPCGSGAVSAADLRDAAEALRRLPPKPRRSLLSALSPVEALAAVAEASAAAEERDVPPPAACARRAVMLAAMLAAGGAVHRALEGPAGAVRAAHLAVSAAAAALGPLATSPSAPVMRVAGCLRLLSLPESLGRLAQALRLAAPALAAHDPIAPAREAAEGAAARVGKAWPSATAPGAAGAAVEDSALAVALWGRAQGAEALAARELLEAHGLAGCSPEEVVALQAVLAE